MKTENEEIDKTIQELVNNKTEQGLPSNFTHLMMQKIEQEAERKTLAKEPLISPVGWLIFGGFAALIITSLVFGDFTEAGSITLPKIDLSTHMDNIILIVGTFLAIGSLMLLDSVYRRKSKKQRLS